MRNPEPLRLNLGIGVLHAILMASFVALPLALVEEGGLAKEEHWWVYLSALLVGFFGMVPFIIYAEKKRRMKRVLCGAVAMLVLCELYFWAFGHGLKALVLGFILFFTAFDLLEASLPSLVSKVAPAVRQGHGHGRVLHQPVPRRRTGAAFWVARRWYQHGGLGLVFVGLCVAGGFSAAGSCSTMREPPYVTSLAPPACRDGAGRQRAGGATPRDTRRQRRHRGGRGGRVVHQSGHPTIGPRVARASARRGRGDAFSLGERNGPWG